MPVISSATSSPSSTSPSVNSDSNKLLFSNRSANSSPVTIKSNNTQSARQFLDNNITGENRNLINTSTAILGEALGRNHHSIATYVNGKFSTATQTLKMLLWICGILSQA